MDLNDIYQSVYTPQSKYSLRISANNQFTININDYLEPIIGKIKPLKRSVIIINQQIQQLKQYFLTYMKESFRKIMSIYSHTYQQKLKIQKELQLAKYSHNQMKQQVEQLREMINQFLVDNNKEIKKKDLYIFQLQESLKINGITLPLVQNQSRTEEQSKLTSIQEVTEDEVSKESSKLYTMRQLSETLYDSQQKQSQPTRKNIRNFIDNFRKTIQESQTNQKIKRDTMIIQTKSSSGNGSNISTHKISLNESKQTISKINSLQSSCNQLLILGDSTKINQLLKNDSPKHISFLKKRSQNTQIYQNICITQESQENPKSIFSTQESISRKNHQRNISGEKQRQSLKRFSSRTSNSRNSSASKEKIKVTTKIVEQANIIHKKRALKKVGSVRLGGKHYITKIRTTIKQAFYQYKIWSENTSQQIKYEGLLIQNYREGFGKLYYKNGFVYEGFFKKNYKHGKGILHYKDKKICQGTWQYGQLNGHACVNLGIFSQSCPQALKQATFKGNINKNIFEGPGEIIFPNVNEKIVTKFHKGIPTGQFTLYAEHHIDFGFWPQ